MLRIWQLKATERVRLRQLLKLYMCSSSSQHCRAELLYLTSYLYLAPGTNLRYTCCYCEWWLRAPPQRCGLCTKTAIVTLSQRCGLCTKTAILTLTAFGLCRKTAIVTLRAFRPMQKNGDRHADSVSAYVQKRRYRHVDSVAACVHKRQSSRSLNVAACVQKRRSSPLYKDMYCQVQTGQSNCNIYELRVPYKNKIIM